MSDEKGTPGRPTEYKPEYDKLAENYCLLKATDQDLADFFEVSETSINNWKKSHLSFLVSIKKGKDHADCEAVEKLKDRAFGFEKEEDRVFCSNGQIVKTTIKKYYPPDTGALAFWLKNRQPKFWRDKPEPPKETQGFTLTFDQLEKLSKEEFEQLKHILSKLKESEDSDS